MTKRFNAPHARRLSAVAIAAALAAFAGVSAAQTRATTPAYPGYVTNAGGELVKNGFGGCVLSGQGPVRNSDCPQGAASAQRTGAAAAPAANPSAGFAAPAAASASAASGATTGTRGMPGYAVASDGNVVRSGFGQCVRSGHWTPANAAEPCDRMATASVPAPVPVAAPQPEPAPAPVVQAAPPAQPEPPRLVIQKITLSADLLFEFDKAQLRDSGKQKLDELAANAKDARVEEVVAVGYADPIGAQPYNEKLSAERAASVKDYLVQQGVAPDTIKTQGKGETQEFTEGKCAKLSGQRLIQCFEPNRRVDVELLGSRQVAAGETPAGTGATAR